MKKKKILKLVSSFMLTAVLHELMAQGGVVENFGISFGIRFTGLLVVNLIVFLLCIYWWLKGEWGGLVWMIIGSAVNLTDRLRFGFVRDYWQIPGTGVYNNVNDWAIFFGIMLFLWKILK